MTNLGDLLTVQEAATYLGVSGDTVRRWSDSGRLAHQRHPVSGWRLYDQKTLDAFLAQVQPQPAKQSRSRGRTSTP